MNILKDNGKYRFYNSLSIVKELEPKNYLFNYDDFGNCFLEDTNQFKMPEKVYDIDKELRALVKKSFEHNETNLGVLLTGNKGQGKSVTAKLMCQDLGLPVIMINKKIPLSVGFVKFLKEIEQDHVLFIDEFEKLFNSNRYDDDGEDVAGGGKFHSQDSFLSLMDGALTSKAKTLFLLTTNSDVNSFMINRPSRIKFLKEYTELPEDLFNLIVDDKLQNKEFKKDLENSVSFLNLNVDLLINIINDINLLNKPFSEFSGLYNYRFEKYKYDVWIIKDAGESWLASVSLDYKPKYNHNYISNYPVKNMVKMTKEEIIFESEIINDKGKREPAKIKMVPFSNFTTTKFTF